MGVTSWVKDKIFKGGNTALTIPNIVTKGTSLGYSWFEGRDKLAELAGGAASTLNPKMTVPRSFMSYRSWVFACINLIQRKIVQTQFYLYKERGQPNDEEFDRILSHPFLKLLRKPNKFQSGRELMQATQIHLDLTGMAFWLILFNNAGVPGELHSLNPAHLTNIFRGETTDNIIERFAFAPPYQRQLVREYSYAEIVYFHYPDPQDVIMPLSPLQALAHVIDIDLLLQVYHKDFFGNNARPDGLLTTDLDIDPEEATRIQEDWNARYRGAGRQHKIAILTSGLGYQPIGMSAKDFEFPSLSEWTKDQILACFGIPEAELGLFESFNKASSISSETKFVKGCIQPRIDLWEDVLNTQLLPLYHNTDDLEFKFENPLPKDDEWQLTETQTTLSMGLSTINEERKKRGLKAFDSPLCDVPWSITGEPMPGVSAEADQLWDKKMQTMMGMQQPQDGQAQAPSNMPAAQGGMGQLGGRPEGQALSTLLNSASRRINTPLATLLNAARGRRGGLAALVSNHPEEIDLMSALDRNRTDQAFSKLLGTATKGYEADKIQTLTGDDIQLIQEMLFDRIESELDEADKFMFRPYEAMLKSFDLIEEQYISETELFFVEKGENFSESVEKLIHEFETKGEDGLINYEELIKAFQRSAEPYIVRGIELGIGFGVQLVEKAGNTRSVTDPQIVAIRSAGKLLNKSADLKVTSVKRTISKILKNGIREGLSTQQIADNIKDQFAGMSGSRTMMIARTELAAAMNHGLDVSFDKMNEQGLIVKEIQSWSALDERVCDDPNPDKNCKHQHGEVMKSYVKNKTYKTLPHHPNCRCVYKPIFVT